MALQKQRKTEEREIELRANHDIELRASHAPLQNAPLCCWKAKPLQDLSAF
jgi:hypothetical protein